MHKYKPVVHTKEKTARLLAVDPGLKKAYDALDGEFAAIDACLSARNAVKPGRVPSRRIVKGGK